MIAAAAGGPLDLIRHGENGWLGPGCDGRLLRDQVAAPSGDVQLRSAMARRARASVRARSWDRIGAELVEHYRSVLTAPVVDIEARRKAQ